MDGRENVPLEGELNCWTRGFDMPDVLLTVCETGKTGLLRFASAEAEKTLFIREGEIIFAKSSSLDDRLGEYLLRNGQISIHDLMRLAAEVRPGKRLGTILVENEILEPKELVQAVIGQVRAIILSLFRWTEAWYGFSEEELPNETITLNMPTGRLIIDGIQLIESWRRIAQGVGELSSVYRKVSGNEEALRSLNLDAATLEVLAILSQPRSVEQVCATSRLPDLDVCRHLWVFRCLGWTEQTDSAEAAHPSTARDAPEVEPKEDVEGESPLMQEEPVVGVGEDSPKETMRLPESPSPKGAVPDVPESAPSPDEPDIRIDVQEDTPIAASLADLQESKLDLVVGEIGEREESPAVAFETDYPVPPPQFTPEPAAPLNTSAADAHKAPVIGGTAIPSETSSTDGDEVPVIEGAQASSETSSVDTDEAPVIEGIVLKTGAEETETEAAASAETKKQSVVGAEDMDFEGLGMVLGEEDDK